MTSFGTLGTGSSTVHHSLMPGRKNCSNRSKNPENWSGFELEISTK